MKKLTLPVRATPPSERFPNGSPAEMRDGYYGQEALRLMHETTRRADAAEGEERRGLVAELSFLHELHAEFPPDEDGTLGIRVLSESVTAEKRREWGEPVEAAITGHGEFQIPSKALPQTALFGVNGEPAPAASAGRSGASRLPYKDDAVPEPVGTPGAFGGRVPSFTVEEAAAMFAVWKADEFGWLKTRVLLLAHEHEEYHSEMLVGLPLSNRNLIGAVTNTLGAADLMEPFNKRGQTETRISSSTSRRRSNVWRLTITGRTMADDLAQSPHVVAWAFPERSGSE